jgi:TatD DNase family protein
MQRGPGPERPHGRGLLGFRDPWASAKLVGRPGREARHPMLIDSHAHLQDRKFSRDLDRVLERADDAGIGRLICIADHVQTSRQAIALARRFRQLSATVGLHPNHIRRFRSGTIGELRELAADPSVVAIGETGLDFHYPDSDPHRQIEGLHAQAELAGELGLPLVLHCRDAYPALIEFFRGEPAITARGVVHCFAGSMDEARALLDLGFYLGVGGALTYPGAQDLRETVKFIGLDRIVAETDAPYLPPQPKRGRRNEPSYMKFTVRALSDLFDRTFQDVARITTANARSLYGLDEEPTPALAYALSKRLYLNVTNQCTNECCYCERNASYCLYGHYLKLPGEPSATEILEAIEEPERFEEFVICGLGEPTLRLDVVLDVARGLKDRGCRVRLNTNGHGNLIHGRDITGAFAGLLDSVAVTMNAADQATYNRVSCPGDEAASFDAMLDFTRRIKRVVPDVRMKVVALPEVDIEACRRLAEDDLKVRFQVRPYRPHGYPLPVAV